MSTGKAIQSAVSSVKTVAYLIDQPLDHRNYDRFGIESWIKRGWVINIFDITPISRPAAWQDFIKRGGVLKELTYYFPILSFGALISIHKTFRQADYFIDLTGTSLYSIAINIAFKFNGTIRIVCALGSIPQFKSNSEQSLRQEIGKLIKGGFIESSRLISRRLAGKLLRKLSRYINKPGFGVVSGAESFQAVQSARKLIYAHNLDYDIFLRIEHVSNLPQNKYIVFIDQDNCFHSDFLYSNVVSPVSPETYFPAVVGVLRKVAESLGTSIRVAAHPRSSYLHSKQDFFDGLPIFYGSTAELIRDAEAVVAHDSTALQFAVLFQKPILFVTTDELNALCDGIQSFASELGKNAINIDRDISTVDWQMELIVDTKRYADYRRKYIKMDGSSEKPAWDIVIDGIQCANGNNAVSD